MDEDTGLKPAALDGSRVRFAHSPLSETSPNWHGTALESQRAQSRVGSNPIVSADGEVAERLRQLVANQSG